MVLAQHGCVAEEPQSLAGRPVMQFRRGLHHGSRTTRQVPRWGIRCKNDVSRSPTPAPLILAKPSESVVCFAAGISVQLFVVVTCGVACTNWWFLIERTFVIKLSRHVGRDDSPSALVVLRPDPIRLGLGVHNEDWAVEFRSTVI